MKRIALLLSCLSLVSMLMGVPARRVRFVAAQIDGNEHEIVDEGVIREIIDLQGSPEYEFRYEGIDYNMP